jgi:hypothetical protein
MISSINVIAKAEMFATLSGAVNYDECLMGSEPETIRGMSSP